MNPTISFCISTRNNSQKLCSLLHHLLSIKNSNIEVVVLDNCSEDDTLAKLDEMDDKRLIIYEQTEPVDYLSNIFDCMCLATAKWILIINNIDNTDICNIDELIYDLNYLESQHIAFAILDKSLNSHNRYSIYNIGHDTIAEFSKKDYTNSNSIMKKECWNNISAEAKNIFENATANASCPFGYIYSILGKSYGGAYIYSDIANQSLSTFSNNNIYNRVSFSNTPLVSIIMPVYNRPQYFKVAVDSLYSQTYKNFEIICINDGSTDTQILELLNTYQNSYINFSFYTIQKHGAGYARNYGFQFANGKYTMFLDSDDLFDQKLLVKMVNSAESNSSEITFCNFISFSESNGKINLDNTIFGTNHQKINDRTDEFWIQSMIKNPWSKMFLTDFLLKNKIHFQEIASANDVAFSVISNILATRYSVLDQEPLIYYRISQNRISSTRKSSNAFLVIEYIQKELFHRNIINDLLQHQLDIFYVFFTLDEIRFCHDKKDQVYTLQQLVNRISDMPIEINNSDMKQYFNRTISTMKDNIL